MGSSVYERKKYNVKSVAEVKQIALIWLSQIGLTEAIAFGLPEVDDRYHIWRVPLKSNVTHHKIGEIVIDTYSTLIDEGKMTKPEILKTRIFNGQDNSAEKKKRYAEGYQISPQRNTIVLGNTEFVLQEMAAQSVDLIFTSPPYYNARPEYSDYITYEEYLLKMRKIIENCHRVLNEGRFFVMNISPVLIRRASRSEASKRIAVPFDIHRIFVEEGFDFVDDIIWVKPEGAGWATGRGRRFAADRTPLQYKPVPVTEYVLVYRKHTDKLIDWNIRTYPSQEVVRASKIEDAYDKTNVWRINPSYDKNHPAIFPLELAERVIKYYSFKTDVVLDPFVGIGTVGKAAIKLDRRFVLIEINPKYIAIMKREAHKWLGKKSRRYPILKLRTGKYRTGYVGLAYDMNVIDYFPEEARKTLSSNGKDIIQEIGLDIIKGVVLDVLTGKNLRDSTELLTRKRIISVNVATLVMLIKGNCQDVDFIEKLPDTAYLKLRDGHLSKDERWLMQWILGLTDKGFQNILRDDTSGLEKYKNDFIDITQRAIEEFNKNYGAVDGTIALNSKEKAVLNWEFLVQLMTVVGAGTLAIRGSNKSTFGKLFEKLVLGALLFILGFKLVRPNEIGNPERVFWLSLREEKRESDATLLYEAGKGVRFDIGFIGRGNPEISLDKVSRFEREIELGKRKWYMATIIIVDRIGMHSRIETLAQAINGSIVQMSGAYWPVRIAKILHQSLGYDNTILHTSIDNMNNYLKEEIAKVPFEEILSLPVFTEGIENHSVLASGNEVLEDEQEAG